MELKHIRWKITSFLLEFCLERNRVVPQRTAGVSGGGVLPFLSKLQENAAGEEKENATVTT